MYFQAKLIEFQWSDIQSYEIDRESSSFNFEFLREGRKPRWIRIFTPYVRTLLMHHI